MLITHPLYIQTHQHQPHETTPLTCCLVVDELCSFVTSLRPLHHPHGSHHVIVLMNKVVAVEHVITAMSAKPTERET